MTSGATAPTLCQPKHGDVVTVGGREATFLYARGHAAVVRFTGEAESRVVPVSKLCAQT
jgi:hypothetical protein